jgi:hypothetical protein
VGVVPSAKVTEFSKSNRTEHVTAWAGMDERDRNAAINKIERPEANDRANKPALIRLQSFFTTSSTSAPLAWGQFEE